MWLLAVVLLPLAFVSSGELVSASAIAYLEVPKIALLRTLVGLMAILWLIEWGIQGWFSPITLNKRQGLLAVVGGWPSTLRTWLGGQAVRWIFLAAGFFQATTLISTALSTSFAVSMWGEVPGEDGYAAYTVIAYVLLFAVVATHLRTRPQLWRLLGAIVLMGALVAFYSVLQHYDFDPFDLRFPPNLSRATSTVGNPILAGAIMLMTIPITLTLAAVTLRGPMGSIGFWQKTGFWVLVLSLQLLGIIFTQSRGPWLGTFIALAGVLGLVLVFVGWRFLIRTALVLGLAALMTFAVLYVPSIFPEGTDKPSSTALQQPLSEGLEGVAPPPASTVTSVTSPVPVEAWWNIIPGLRPNW